MELGYMSKSDLKSARDTIKVSDKLLIDGIPLQSISSITNRALNSLTNAYQFRAQKIQNNTHGNGHYETSYHGNTITKAMVSDYFYFTSLLKSLLLFYTSYKDSQFTLNAEHQAIMMKYDIDKDAYLGFIIIHNTSPVLPSGELLPDFKEQIPHYKAIGIRFNTNDRTEFAAWKEVRRKSTSNNVKRFIQELYKKGCITEEEKETSIKTLDQLIDNYQDYYIKTTIISILLNIHPGISTMDRVILLYLLGESETTVTSLFIQNKKQEL